MQHIRYTQSVPPSKKPVYGFETLHLWFLISLSEPCLNLQHRKWFQNITRYRLLVLADIPDKGTATATNSRSHKLLLVQRFNIRLHSDGLFII